ncbi:phosphodiester glycosidase family protein [Paenibacillus sp. S-38]|uniref:phosphodiester glycosidase family protein n=1 Tax=Paenibacillus sp. S-38 TaxID=3416710 RepID=UPI003CE9BDCB
MQLNRNIGAFRAWGRLKKTLFSMALFTFMTSSFLYLTGPGGEIRQWLAETVITTQHRSWAWIFVGAERRDALVQETRDAIERAAKEKQDMSLLNIRGSHGNARSADELVKVEDISGQFWKGKKMYVYDPKTIRVMTPSKVGEGEKITSMVERTGAVAGVNGGSFDDPEGLGNGFAAIGMIISGGDIVFTDQDGSIPQHIVGFTKEGALVVGKYDAFELRDMGISEAVSFYPRLIANGKGLITNGDGGWGRAPRTAVGQKADGTVIFIVIDGRQSHSVGATLKEVQDLFLKEGVINAGNLDGGASSELVYKGDDDEQSKLLSKPSSRYGERRLPSAFLVYDDPESVHAIRIWDGVDKIDAGGSYDHPEFLKEQAEKKAKQSTTTTKPAVEKSKTEPSSTSGTTKPAETTKPAASKGTETKTTTDSKSAPAKTDSKNGTAPAAGSTAPGTAPAAGSPAKGDGTPDPGTQSPAGSTPAAGSGTTDSGTSAPAQPDTDSGGAGTEARPAAGGTSAGAASGTGTAPAPAPSAGSTSGADTGTQPAEPAPVTSTSTSRRTTVEGQVKP